MSGGGDLLPFLGSVIPASLVVAAIVIGWSRGKTKIIDDYERITANLREEMQDNDRRCEARLNEQTRTIAHLEGRVEVLASQQADALATVLAPRVVEGVVKAIQSGDWNGG